MDAVFLNSADKVLFVRDDMEEGHWVQEEMNLTAVFPFVSDKKISRGQRILIQDPATDATEVFEIRNVQSIENEHYQQITAEHIVISELTDEHIDEQEMTDISPQAALEAILAETLWQVGNVTASNTSSADIARGSVWQAVNTIKSNWNVYIEPRIAFSSNGITGRYLDILPAGGTWRGVHIAIDKNVTDDIIVTNDDSEVVTAMYGYGGTEDGEIIKFTNVKWAKTADHPAKPAGRAYIEDTSATSTYGRNGRPRFGYYQNAQITDPEILLQKTWEALKEARKPKITIEGTITDLYRLGYADQPLRLHDTALVDVHTINETLQEEIIQMDVDLIDASATRVTIGQYIPNIIYIARKTEEEATGEKGGGGRRSGSSKNNVVYDGFATAIQKSNQEISLRAYKYDLDHIEDILEEAGITITRDGVKQYAWKDKGALTAQLEVQAQSITSEVTNRQRAEEQLSSKITQTANSISQIVQAVGANGKITAASIVAAINGSSSSITLSADHINIDGLVNKLTSKTVRTNGLQCNALRVDASAAIFGNMSVTGEIASKGRALKVSDASISGDVLTIIKVDGTKLTFSKATSLGGKWSGGIYTVTASPQGDKISTKLYGLNRTGSPTRSGKWVYQDFYVMYATESASANTGAKLNAGIDASSVYNAAWSAAVKKLSWPGVTSTTKATISIGYPTTTVDGAAGSMEYTLSADSSYCYIKDSDGNTVARIANASLSHSISASGLTINVSGDNLGSRTNLGYFSKANLNSGYITFNVSCGGTSKGYYIRVTN